jgi:hypothetical protein
MLQILPLLQISIQRLTHFSFRRKRRHLQAERQRSPTNDASQAQGSASPD